MTAFHHSSILVPPLFSLYALHHLSDPVARDEPAAGTVADSNPPRLQARATVASRSPVLFSFFLFCFSVYIFKIVVGSSFSETYDSARCRSVPIHHEYNSKRRRTEEETFISICYDSEKSSPHTAFVCTPSRFSVHNHIIMILIRLYKHPVGMTNSILLLVIQIKCGGPTLKKK